MIIIKIVKHVLRWIEFRLFLIGVAILIWMYGKQLRSLQIELNVLDYVKRQIRVMHWHLRSVCWKKTLKKIRSLLFIAQSILKSIWYNGFCLLVFQFVSLVFFILLYCFAASSFLFGLPNSVDEYFAIAKTYDLIVIFFLLLLLKMECIHST